MLVAEIIVAPMKPDYLEHPMKVKNVTERASSLYSRIIVGVDDSEPSKEAVALAARLASEHGGALVLVHSVDWLPLIAELESSGAIVDPTPVVDGLKEQGRALLAQAAAAAKRSGIEAKRCAMEGDPAENLLREATASECSLIVLGTHGRRGVGRLLIGSTTEAVLRGSDLPVLTIRPGETTAAGTRRCFERVVVGIDDSEPSDAAVATVCALPAGELRRVVFCSVAGVAIVIGDRTYHEAAMDDFNKEAQRVVERAVAAARAHGIAAEGRVLDGNTEHAVIAAAVQEQADLIVLGSHGRRGMRRFFLGSVAEAIVRTAPVPVLVVRTGSLRAAGRP
jgi:nucleotide-binding universal stress UspA family protein